MPDRALEGLRVIEAGSGFGAASYAAKLMADLGAEVIKVEPPEGDEARRLGPFPGGEPHPEKSGAFLYANCNKQGVTLNLTVPEGQEILQRLLARADAFFHDFPPPQARALGLSYERVQEANPEVVMVSISPFGQDGPHRDYKAYDINIASAGGWTWINGWPGQADKPPLKPYGRQTAYQSGVTAAVTAMGALFSRLRSGRGQHIDVSAQECIASIIEMTYTFWPYMKVPAVRWGQRPIHPIDFFQCKDGGWIFALCIEEHQWQSLVQLMETPEWATWEVAANRFVRAANWDALRPFMEEWVAQWNTDDLYRAAQARRIPFAPASTLADLLRSDHLQARGFFVEVGHPRAGSLKHPGAPFKLSETPWEIRSPAPALGQHNEQVLGRELGLTDRLAGLKEAGVI